MIIEKKKNTINGAFWGYVNKFCTLLFPFIIRTIIIKRINADYIGVYSVINSVINFLNISELGISSAIIFNMYDPVARGDGERICVLLGFYRKLYRIIGAVIGTLGFVITPVIGRFIGGDISIDSNIYVLYLIYLSNTVLSYLVLSYRQSLYLAYQRNDKLYIIQTAVFTVQSVIQIILLLLTENYYIYCIIFPIFTVVQNLCIGYFSTKDYPEYKCKGKISGTEKTAIKKQTCGIMVGRINSVIRNQLDTIFISVFLGVSATTIYSNYFYTIVAAMSLITILISVMTAGIGNSIIINSKEANYEQFNVFLYLIQWVVGFTGIFYICVVQIFMKIWVGGVYMFPDELAALFGVYYFALNVDLNRALYCSALGIWWEMRNVFVIEIILNAVLNFVLVKRFGVGGVICATILTSLGYSVAACGYTMFKNYFGLDKFKEYMVRMAMFAVVFFVSAYCIYRLFYTFGDGGMLGFAVKLIFITILVNVIYVFMIFKSEYRENIKVFVLAVFDTLKKEISRR